MISLFSLPAAPQPNLVSSTFLVVCFYVFCRAPQIEKSPNDPRSYRAVQLPSGMKVTKQKPPCTVFLPCVSSWYIAMGFLLFLCLPVSDSLILYLYSASGSPCCSVCLSLYVALLSIFLSLCLFVFLRGSLSVFLSASLCLSLSLPPPSVSLCLALSNPPLLNIPCQALLVSDPDTKTSAAAMDVHVGHFSDPGK